MKYDYQRLRDEFERKLQEDHQITKEKIKQSEEKYNKMVIEKNNIEYTINKYREVTTNNEFNSLIEEAQLLDLQIANLEKERLDFRIKIDFSELTSNSNSTNNIKSPVLTPLRKNNLSSKESGSATILRRKVEEYKDNMLDIEAHIEIYNKKKAGVENELINAWKNENQRFSDSKEFEKQNYQVSHLYIVLINCYKLAEN